ncbi:50S ribosomal protein L23 [bacterium BFN5]|jgi:large subunit ribosomal protein L23|nr:50S ribosomal protein L23 [bacterium BFN5]QJW45046.1 50S ribosomal protein L23 [bacterium BFN5]
MTNARDVLLRPMVTEKTTSLMQDSKYTFVVAPSANKIEIRKAVEEIFKVKVLDVHTIRVLGKTKRMGRTQGKRSDYKKAIVKLAPGERIEFFEGV